MQAYPAGPQGAGLMARAAHPHGPGPAWTLSLRGTSATSSLVPMATVRINRAFFPKAQALGPGRSDQQGLGERWSLVGTGGPCGVTCPQRTLPREPVARACAHPHLSAL